MLKHLMISKTKDKQVNIKHIKHTYLNNKTCFSDKTKMTSLYLVLTFM